MDRPFIHTFAVFGNYFLYDVNTDQIIEINEGVYNALCDNDDSAEVSNHTAEALEQLRNLGLLRPYSVKTIEHPATQVLPDLLNNKLHFITLQVTQRCNLRCDYCVYSGKYKNRQHSQREMSLETAKAAIDYLVNHSRDAKDLAVGFYGGEPLMNFSLIRECVKYAKQKAEGKKINFSVTTNGTLLSDEVVDILVDNQFYLTISVDGPASIHDQHRKFATTDVGSFDVIKQHLQRLKQRYPVYYREMVLYNIVLDPMNSFSEIDRFFIEEPLFGDNVAFSATLIDDRYAEDDIPSSIDFQLEFERGQYLYYLSKLGRIERSKVSRLLDLFFAQSTMRRIGKQGNMALLPEKTHRGGPCVPGTRLFVSADGDLYPCERVSETSCVSKIGNVKTGIDIGKAKYLLNLEQLTPSRCRECWAYRYCTVCIAEIDGLEAVDLSVLSKKCSKVKASIEESFKEYLVLKYCGYDFEMELQEMSHQF